MSFQFTAAQASELITLIDAAEAAYQVDPDGDGIWTAAYQRIYEMITDQTLNDEPLAGVDYYVWRWIGGAQDVNADTGGFAGFIRDYTEFQHQFRYGTSMAPTEIQEASNGVASNFFADVRDNLTGGSMELPTIREIGAADAGAAAAVVFDGDYAPWAGTLLFPYLNCLAPCFGTTDLRFL